MKNNEQGFSLVEIMVAVAGMGGLLALGMNLSTQFHQDQVTTDARFETLEVRRLITTVLFEENACSNTFSGKKIGEPVTEIKNAFPDGGKTVLDISKNGTSNVKIQGMKLMKTDPNPDGSPNVVLAIDFKKSKEKDRNHYQPVLIPLKVKLNLFDEVSSCRVNSDKFVLKVGDEMTGPLTTSSFVSTTGIVATLNVLAANFCTGFVCRAISELALNNQLCAANQISRGVKADGSLDCVDLQFSCNPGQGIQAITPGGGVICANLVP